MLQLHNSLHAGDDPAGFELGFDDGDVRLYSDDELAENVKVGLLKALDAGTDQARFELRLQPQLDSPSPLGRGSSHAPNKPV